jgi:XTP/dITP diphosphohydrolase
MKVLLASRNTHKLAEFHELLPDLEFLPWPSEAPEIPEDGAFFQDNALQKATFALDWWRSNRSEPVVAALADDSGLCVDALYGGPGVLSARFAHHLSQGEKNLRLLTLMPEGGPRTARFVCVLAWALAAGECWTVSGSVEGRLALEPRGVGGFGYDPLFIPEGHEQTFGELPSEVKHQLSHRGRASRALLARLGR